MIIQRFGQPVWRFLAFRQKINDNDNYERVIGYVICQIREMNGKYDFIK